MNLDLNALEAFEAVVEHGTVAGAARKLNKAQSAISYHLRRLEEQLGTALLDRSGYRLRLTAEGETVLSEARPILRKLRDLSSYAARYRAGWEPELKIFFDGALPTHAIIAALGALEAEGAPTRVQLRVGFLDGVQNEFIRHRGDIMIAALYQQQPDLALLSLPPMDFRLCCGRHHPLASLASVSLADLQEHTELIIPNRMMDEPALPARHFHSRRVFHLSDFHTKLAAIREGLGFGWLPDFMAAPLLQTGELHAITCDYNSEYRLQPVLATWSTRKIGKAADIVIQHIRAHGWTTA